MSITPEQGIKYYKTLSDIGAIRPLKAVDVSPNAVELRLDFPDSPDGENMLAVAQLLCTVCKLNGICTTLQHEERERERGSTVGIRRQVGTISLQSNNSHDGGGSVVKYNMVSKRFEAYRAIRGQAVRRDAYIGTSLCTCS